MFAERWEFRLKYGLRRFICMRPGHADWVGLVSFGPPHWGLDPYELLIHADLQFTDPQQLLVSLASAPMPTRPLELARDAIVSLRDQIVIFEAPALEGLNIMVAGWAAQPDDPTYELQRYYRYGRRSSQS